VQIVAVVGAVPGVGKTTLCRALAARLADEGVRVELFDEADVLVRPEFARVAEEFRSTGVVSPRILVDATVAYLFAMAESDVEVAVTDSLMPFVPSLLAFGHDEPGIADVAASLRERMPPASTLAVVLHGDEERALARAAAREGAEWLDWYGAKLAGYGLVPSHPDMADLCGYLVRERVVTMRVLATLPWEVLEVDDALDRSADSMVDAVLTRLEPDPPATSPTSSRPAVLD
jgi:hypothetical protein